MGLVIMQMTAANLMQWHALIKQNIKKAEDSRWQAIKSILDFHKSICGNPDNQECAEEFLMMSMTKMIQDSNDKDPFLTAEAIFKKYSEES